MDAEKGKRGKDFDPLSRRIIGSAIEVHRELGPGYIESFYENAMVVQLRLDGLSYVQQLRKQVLYKGHPIGDHRTDLIVDAEIIVELKAIKELEPIHFTTLRSYLKAHNLRIGLLFNFSTMPLTIRRLDRDRPEDDRP